MDDLRTRVADLESELRRVRAEWADVLDRLTRIGERQRKREERSEQPELAPGMGKASKAALWSRLKARGATNGS